MLRCGWGGLLTATARPLPVTHRTFTHRRLICILPPPRGVPDTGFGLGGDSITGGFSSRLWRRIFSTTVFHEPGRRHKRTNVLEDPSCRGLKTGPSGGLAAGSGSLAARLVAAAPAGMQPYLKLARLDKPVGRFVKGDFLPSPIKLVTENGAIYIY
jgi:hypothetical protein